MPAADGQLIRLAPRSHCRDLPVSGVCVRAKPPRVLETHQDARADGGARDAQGKATILNHFSKIKMQCPAHQQPWWPVTDSHNSSDRQYVARTETRTGQKLRCRKVKNNRAKYKQVLPD
ncbi:hypothetical protein SRHO_G00188400 [Serrasalmus rhombeus]